MLLKETSALGSSVPSLPAAVSFAILIPAYRPGEVLIDIIRQLASGEQEAIVVVDDGSGPAYERIFEEIGRVPKVRVIRQPANLGKGSALKCGIAFLLRAFPQIDGIVTVDADGQHDPADVRKVCERFQDDPDALVLGVRCFQGSIPLRSKLGNSITRRVMRAVLGKKLTDSQTGLRAIPDALLRRALKARGSRYEFELETLIAAKHMGVKIFEEPIRTIYEPGNPTSHFQPLRDSMRIGYVLLRFSMIGILSAILDNLVFYLLFRATGSILGSQVGARIVSVCFNYSAVRSAVFLSDEPHRVLLPRYLLLTATNCLLSYVAIRVLTSVLPTNVLFAKVLVETLLFIVNLTVQREWVFTKRGHAPSATDWDRYYQKVSFTARLTRKYTQSVLISAMKRSINWREQGRGSIVELGGANSCFLGSILRVLRPRTYHIVDSNEFGLSLLRRRLNGRLDVTLHHGDVLSLRGLSVRADCVFSVGLIEHFDPDGTRKAIRTHFDLLRHGGCAIISFPTPTWLYKIARAVAEAVRLWHFPDERPLAREEVMEVVRSQGTVLFEKTLWPLIFTQHFVVVRKRVPMALAYVRFLRGQRGPALDAAKRALELNQAVRTKFLTARIYAAFGESAKARELATSLSPAIELEPQAYGKLIEGEIALKNGDGAGAVKLFMDGNRLLDTWIGHFDLGRAYLLTGAFTQADSEFDLCLKRKGEALSLFLDATPTFAYFPPLYYYQGQAREGMKSTGFAESYKKYLSIRGKANEDPLLAEVRRRAG